MSRFETIARMALFIVPLTVAIGLLGFKDHPKIQRKEYATMLLACLLIALFGAAFNYLLTPSV